jgi:hypothetical protein
LCRQRFSDPEVSILFYTDVATSPLNCHRSGTGDIQLGKLIDEGPEDYDPFA